MIDAYQYTGERNGDVWVFRSLVEFDPAEFNLGGEPIPLDWRTSVSLSERSIERLLHRFRGREVEEHWGGGLNQEDLYLSTAVGKMLKHLTPGLVRVFEIPDEQVDRHLSEIRKV